MDFSAALLQYLANVSLRALPVAAAAMALLAVLRIRAGAARHAVWAVVAAGMLLSAGLSPVLPPLPLRILPVSAEPLASAPAEAGATVTVARAGSPPARQPHPQPGFWNWQRPAAGLYLAGLFFFAARLAFSYLFTRRLMRASRPAGRDLAQDVYESAWISVPMTSGLLHPRIFLPADWPHWERAKLDAVLAHERCHVRRGDWAIGAMAAVNRCVFWFHPLAWWLERKLALLAEEACDDAALLLLGQREPYAQALLDMAAAVSSGQGRLVWEAMAMAKASEVKHRIERILDETRRIPQGLTRPRWAALLACGLPMIYLATVVQPAPVRAQEQQPRTVIYSDRSHVFVGTLSEGTGLKPAEAAALEQELRTNPEDAPARRKLLDYYFVNNLRDSRVESVLWLIRNHPESELLGRPPVLISRKDPAYQQAAALWHEQIAVHLNDTPVLGNAAHFFADPVTDPAEAERLFQEARTREPSNANWTSRLAGLYFNSITIANRAADPGWAQHANPQFAADAALRLENSTDVALLTAVGRALSSYEVEPGQSRAQALAKVSPGLTPLWELGDRLLARAQQLGAPRRVSAADAEPDLKRVDPVYPPLALQARIQGVVTLEATVGQDGTVRNLRLISGHPLLVNPAMEAVRQWTFGPRDFGKQVEVEVPFQLPESGGGAAKPGAPAPAAGNDVDLPELQPLNRVDPVYPPLARQARITGVVTLIATIGIDGRVTELKAAGGHPLLIPSALTAARQWTYSPQTAPTKTRMQIQFELQ